LQNGLDYLFENSKTYEEDHLKLLINSLNQMTYEILEKNNLDSQKELKRLPEHQ